MKCIIAATDGSDAAERAVEFAAALAKTGEAELSVIHVTRAAPKILAADLEAYARSEHMRLEEALATASEEELSHADRLAVSHGVKRVRTESQSGDPAEVIIRSAREKNADLIVVGRRGRGRLAGLLLGSVSQKLVALAPCAVLVVP
jgi:nucleotide-binding universal stress UspA family protein